MIWARYMAVCVKTYFSYLWDGIKTRFKSFNRIGLFGLIKGLFTNFFESYALVKLDIRKGYIML